jgi:hypothetical protein
VQRFQHRTVATKDHDNVSIFQGDRAEMFAKTLAGASGRYAVGTHEGNFVEGHGKQPDGCSNLMVRHQHGA